MSCGLGGMAYAAFGGQPMTFIGPTGLTLAFMTSLYRYVISIFFFLLALFFPTISSRPADGSIDTTAVRYYARLCVCIVRSISCMSLGPWVNVEYCTTESLLLF